MNPAHQIHKPQAFNEKLRRKHTPLEKRRPKNGNFIVYAIHMKWKYFSWMNLAEGNILLFPVHIQIVFQQTIVFYFDSIL